MVEKAFHHRASLKQKHKAFKRRHATKNQQRDKAKGKTQRASIKGKVLRKHTRLDRRNAVRTEQRKKREQLLMSTRIFSGRHRAPKIVAVIPLGADVRTAPIVAQLYQTIGQTYDPAEPATRHILNVERFKQTVQFVEVERNLLDILDVCKVADYMITVVSADVEVDAFGEQCLAAIQNQGHPSVFPVVQYLERVAAKRRNEVKKSLQSFMSHFFPEADKMYSTESDTEALAILRILTSQVPRRIKWREIRPYMLADNVEFEPSPEDSETGRLAVTGYLRGANLSANRLVHIPNFGDFQIDQIYHVPVAQEAAKANSIDEDTEPTLLDEPNPELQDSLVAANEPDQLNNEQTWPEDDEMAGWKEQMQQMEEEEARMQAERVIRVPKGTSAYQAAWIADDIDESESGSGSDDSMDSDSEDESGSEIDPFEAGEDEEYEEIRVDKHGNPIEDTQDDAADNDDNDDEALSPEEEERQLREYLRTRASENRDDQQFPDEVDTPRDMPARERFARYRGLQSFRTSPWDPYENLPLDYARIFQFENLRRTQHRVVRQTADAPAKSGMHVRVILRQVPRAAAQQFSPTRPLAMFGLLQYEHQMSVVHFTVTRNEEYEAPVRSKDPLVLHCGFRRYAVRPLFSQHTRGGPGTNNVHKFERFLQHGRVSVATVFAPIQFGASPVSLYLPEPADESSLPTLVATGTSLEVNPARILAKRIVLTGAPYKIHKRGAVVRYMFFTPEDIAWFKPVQLHTKYGRTGHIAESLGTHGYMKCIFDGPVTQMDTVCMNLYKRVFPKWNTDIWSEHAQPPAAMAQWVGPVADKTDDAMEL
ncbi:ribosome biogenesis protein tsr1 [Linderina macrospora]|uniref:Ribosome biogenesis protein tsr1 n=1 Tax=Linderina macrospora TaxID=4868 RepID=A0ACC1JFL3_9FUNG|nr:ribosome biogenesis protein tsr1 [Linderina macrospora]